MQYDIIMLQETYITKEKFKEWQLDWKGQFLFVEGTNNSKGLITLINPNFQYNEFKIIINKDRIMCLEIHVQNTPYYFLNIYAPNLKKEKLSFLDELSSVLSKIISSNIIVCGDFNLVSDNKLDIIAGEIHDEVLVKKFYNLREKYSLSDTWRLKNPRNKDFTWSRPTPFTARRLDYILCHDTLVPYIKNSQHRILYGSDHKLVNTTLLNNIFKRGPSYWKLNTSLLKDPEYLTFMNNSIDYFLDKENEFNNPVEFFEMLKSMARTKSIEYSKLKNFKQKKKQRELLNKLDQLNKNLINSPNDEIISRQILTLKNELEIYELYKTSGAIIRSRLRQIEEGEKNTKYFLNLAKAKGNDNTIFSLKKDNNLLETTENHLEIIKMLKQHFEKITKKDENIKNIKEKLTDYLTDVNHPRVSEEDKEFLESPLTMEEMSKALNSLNNESTPGIDGLPTSWYKTFYNKIKTPLFNSLSFSLQTGELSISQKRGIISLFHKGKELQRDIIKNWRPITLTTTDYKIFSKCIATRLQLVLPYLIGTSQSGFLKGRSISDHIRILDDLIILYKKYEKPGMIISLDFERAFDSVEKDTIISVLDKFNFGDSFINMVKVLIFNSESSVQNGGWISGFFTTERGIKQGCCASPLLFILVAEVMAIKIKNNINIKGLSYKTTSNENNSIKILQYADDTSLTLKSTDDLTNALLDLKNFSNLSGLKLNTKKSIGMWIGCNSNSLDKPGGITWIHKGDTMKILGIHFNSHQEASVIEKNWTSKLESIERYIKTLQKQNCSLYGKVVLCKTFLLSQISYLIQSLSLPDQVINKLDSLLFQFIWQKKHSDKKVSERIKRTVMCRTIEEGGLNMIRVRDQQKAFLLKWFHKTVSAEKNNSLYQSKNIYDIFFSKLGGTKYILTSTSINENCTNLMSKFWKDVIDAWVELNKNQYHQNNIKTQDIYAEPLFNNIQIRYKGQSLFYKNWLDEGLLYIKDICTEEGVLSFSQLKEKIKAYPSLIFEYNALINALPKSWLDFIRSSPIPTDFVVNYDEKIKMLDSSNSKLRTLISGDKDNEICGKKFWERKAGVNISSYYKMAKNASKESKLRLLHFKILHNIYPNNILLSRMGIKNTELCDICGVKDYIEHMFVNCALLKGFWKKVFQLIHIYTKEKFPISENNILLGLNYESFKCSKSKVDTANHILLIAKLSISKLRYGKINDINLIFEAEINLRKKHLIMT